MDYTERERQRLLVKPGVTCIWQVSGRSDIDFHTWVDMDLDYIETWSLLLDLKLLGATAIWLYPYEPIRLRHPRRARFGSSRSGLPGDGSLLRMPQD